MFPLKIRKQKPDLTQMQTHTKWKTHKLDCVWQLEFTACSLCASLIQWFTTSATAEKVNTRENRHRKQQKDKNTVAASQQKTYGSDREECVSTGRHSDKPNEFPRSTEWVFILFSDRERAWIPKQIFTAVIGLKMERQLWNEGRGGLLSMHLPVGETNANHLLSCRLAIQHLAEREPASDAAVCCSRQRGWQSDYFLSLQHELVRP